MPIIIGGGNTRAGEVYLDEMARRRQAALNEANFLQSQQNAQQANDRANQELALNRQRAYAQQQGQYDQMAQQTQTHAMDLAAAQARQQAQDAQAQQFHQDEVQHQNAQLQAQGGWHNDELAQQKSRGAFQERELANRESEHDLQRQQHNDAMLEQLVTRETNATADRTGLRRRMNTPLSEEEGQQAQIEYNNLAAETRARLAPLFANTPKQPAAQLNGQNGQTQMLDFANTSASAANREPDPFMQGVLPNPGQRFDTNTGDEYTLPSQSEQSAVSRAATGQPARTPTSAELHSQAFATQQTQKANDKSTAEARRQVEQDRLGSEFDYKKQENTRKQQQHDAEMADRVKGPQTEDFIAQNVDGRTPEELAVLKARLQAKEPADWKTNQAFLTELKPHITEAIAPLKTDITKDAGKLSEDEKNELGLKKWREDARKIDLKGVNRRYVLKKIDEQTGTAQPQGTPQKANPNNPPPAGLDETPTQNAPTPAQPQSTDKVSILAMRLAKERGLSQAQALITARKFYGE